MRQISNLCQKAFGATQNVHDEEVRVVARKSQDNGYTEQGEGFKREGNFGAGNVSDSYVDALMNSLSCSFSFCNIFFFFFSSQQRVLK